MACNDLAMANMFSRLFKREEQPALIPCYLGSYEAQGVQPPPREAASREPLGLSAVFRGVQVLSTAAKQLSLDAYRAGLPLEIQPGIIRRPALGMPRSQWLSEVVTAMALNGNAFLKVERGPGGEVLDLQPLPPAQVMVTENRRGQVVYLYRSQEYSGKEIRHIKFMPVTGHARGLGPVSQAGVELSGLVDLRDYAADIFQANDVPSGVLKSDQKLTEEIVAATKKQWKKTADGGVRVLGSGLDYQRMGLNARDAQFIEARQLSVTDVARLLGVPASLMLATQANTSTTYQNVEQEWIGFVRFTLMAYLKPIEEELSDLLAGGQTARFNLEALLRTDTQSRYAAYQVGIAAGFLTPDEAREHENLPALGRHAANQTVEEITA